jgi:hypothetical protein
VGKPVTTSDNGAQQIDRFNQFMFRFAPSIIGIYLYIALCLLFLFGDRDLYYGILKWWGITPYQYPFIDMKILFTAIDCSRHGVDVFLLNTCMFGQWYSYSPIVLWTAALPFSPEDRNWIGLILGIGFLIFLSALPLCKSWKECWIRSFATISTAVVFGVERAASDLPIFLIILTGIILLQKTSRIRFSAYALLVVAAFLKYYPALLMLLAARERFRTAVYIALATICAAAIFLVPSLSETGQALTMAPAGFPYTDFFGARNLALGFTLIATGPLPVTDIEAARIPLSLLGRSVMAVLLLFSGWIIWRWVKVDSERLQLLEPGQLNFLIAGSIVMAGCFFLSQNISYRAIFLLMTLPGLFAFTRAEGAGRWPMALIYGALFLLWEEFFRGVIAESLKEALSLGFIHFFYWIGRELVWWWVMARLASLVIAFLWRSPALAPVLSLVRIPRPA